MTIIKKKRAAALLLVAALCMVLAAPVAALAIPRTKARHAVATAATTHVAARAARATARTKAAENLEHRVAMAIRNRDIRFENAARAIERNQQRLSDAIATVEAAGGDCTQAKALLEQSKASIAAARSAEATAAATLRSIPGSSDVRGTFKLGREQARAAVGQLKQARTELHEAVRALRVVLNGMKPVESDDASATGSD